jgi:hypothetical protein
MTIAVLQHPEVVAFYRRALARAMRLATLESKLTAKREWQAVAGHCALRMLEIEEASGQEAEGARALRDVAGFQPAPLKIDQRADKFSLCAERASRFVE